MGEGPKGPPGPTVPPPQPDPIQLNIYSYITYNKKSYSRILYTKINSNFFLSVFSNLISFLLFLFLFSPFYVYKYTNI